MSINGRDPEDPVSGHNFLASIVAGVAVIIVVFI